MDRELAAVAAREALAGVELVTPGGATLDDGRPVVPVVICAWNRLDRIRKILRAIEQSQGVRAEVFVWNNRFGAGADLVADLRAHADQLPRTWIANSAMNIGGFGRFYWARELAATYPHVVFIDDDQVVDPFALRTLFDEFTARTLRSVWAFRFKQRTQYWQRHHASPGAQARYVGTGGMIADTSIFLDDAVFACPPTYWFVEDIWLSYVANAMHGWSLYRSHAEIGFVLDNQGQTSRLRYAKARFFRDLSKDPRWIDPVGPVVPAGPASEPLASEPLVPEPRTTAAPGELSKRG